jgi:hypothetical protein
MTFQLLKNGAELVTILDTDIKTCDDEHGWML